MASFNHQQRMAVEHVDHPCLVLAGPGSGKTTVITHRTKKLIEEEGISPSNILVITFTKAAAMEMQQRFLQLMGGKRLPVSFGTFHAVYFQILKYAYNYRAENIIREEKKYEILRNIVHKTELDISDENEFVANLISEISNVKGEMLDVAYYYSKNCPEEVFKKIFREYNDTLIRANLIDFDDMLVMCYELLTKRKDILKLWQDKYRYILIDEFQDINRVQYEVIRLLAKPQDNLFIVGDDDQSIYRFRGARPEIMLNFRKDYPQSGQVLLNDNFRSTTQIVEAAGRVIARNKTRFPKNIIARGGDGALVQSLEFPDQQQECAYILREIQNWQARGGSLRQVAVIYRTNTQPRVVIQKLMEYNLPFRVRDQVPNLFQHWIARDLFCYMRLAMGSGLRKDLLPVLNRPKRYLSRECLNDERISWEYMLNFYKDKRYVCDRIERLQYDLKMMSRMGPFAAINYIRHVIGYEEYLKEYAGFRRMNVEDLLEVLSDLQESAREYHTYEEWFIYIEKYTEEMEQLKKRQQEVKDGVHLTTMHSSKGLEYEKVFILDAAEGITPYKKAVLEADLEEERRMFYVAMTRAKKELTICWTKKVGSHEKKPSRFLEEMQEEV